MTYLIRNRRQKRNVCILKCLLGLLLGIVCNAQVHAHSNRIPEATQSSALESTSQSIKEDLAPFKKFSSGLSKLLYAPNQQNESFKVHQDSDSLQSPPTSQSKIVKTAPRPKNVGLELQIHALSELDQAIALFLQKTSGAPFSILTAIKLTAYHDVLKCIDINASIKLLVFTESTPPQLVALLPVENKRFQPFIKALTQASGSKSSTIDPETNSADFVLNLNYPLELVVRQVSDYYVAVTSKENRNVLHYFQSSNLFQDDIETIPTGLRSPILSIQASTLGLSHLSRPDRPFWQELNTLIDGLKQDVPAFKNLDFKTIQLYVNENLNSMRYDLGINDYGLYSAIQLIVKANSPASKQLASYRNFTPYNPSPDRFFFVLPDVESVIGGQTALSEELTQTLPPPFNQIRFAEYCLGLPANNELGAESFIFYLNVNDAEQFAREMIIPKAREIGRYVGSKQAGDAVSLLMGGIAERRLSRQQGRRVPERRQANPERAAEIGGVLGAALGGLIGESAGEESAMREYRFNGYKMYVSDVETFTRQSALMKAEKEGLVTSDSQHLGFGSLSPAEAIVAAIQNSNALQQYILQTANREAAQNAPSPLFARLGYLVILDKNTIVYSLGNQELLKLAVNNYRATKQTEIRYLSPIHDSDGIDSLTNLALLIPNLSETNVIGVTRFDMSACQAYYNWLQKFYFQKLPTLSYEQLPFDTPKILVVSSALSQSCSHRLVIPYKTIVNLVNVVSGGTTLLELILKPKTSNSTEPDDFDVDFEDE